LDRVFAVVVGIGSAALLGWGHGWGERVIGAVAAFLAVARWFGVNKRAVFLTDEFLVLRGSLFSRRLPWSDVASASVARRGPAYVGLSVRTAGGRTFRPGGVGYIGLRRRADASVDGVAAAINARTLSP
jgi:hypothetical protein